MAGSNPFPRTLVFLALATAMSACSKEESAEPSCARLSVAFSGQTPSRFQVVADPGGDGWRSVDCSPGGERPADARCAASLAVIPLGPAAATVDLTVKAPGYRTVRTTVTPAWGEGSAEAATPAACGGRVAEATVTVPLEPLPDYEVKAPYRTGFDADGGLDAFLSLAVPATDVLGTVYLVKFFVEDLDGQPVAYFQDTAQYRLHWPFVSQVLHRFPNQAEFEAITYHGAGRTQMAGTLVWRPDLQATLDGTKVHGIVTVEWFPNDDLTPDLARKAFLALQERLEFLELTGTERRLAYLPPGTVQEAQAEASARELAASGVTWTRRSTLFDGVTEQWLNPAVSFGTLRKMDPEDLPVAVVSYRDILLLTRLPNDLPLVGGTITEQLQTPLAHVNVAATARKTPNLALLGASTDPRVQPFLGHLVRFEVTKGGFTIRDATVEETDAYWHDRLDRPILSPAFDLGPSGLIPFADLGFDDPATVGVKAANLAELRRVLPANVPDGFAVPFHHYDTFVRSALVTAAACDGARDACLQSGGEAALCERVRTFCDGPAGTEDPGTGTLQDLLDRLLTDPAVATDSVLRNALLAGVRWLFCSIPLDPDLARSLDDAVRQAFGTAKVRLRSSSNAEDLPDFSGAGLYTSVGATLETANPPSTRICQVWASLWNWKAYEERSFWNIDHASSKMAVGVHDAFTDERANGVLITRNLSDPMTYGWYVNVQKGEVPVTNPEGDETPEVFVIVPSPSGGVQAAPQQYSSLSPGAPLLTDKEIGALYVAVAKVQAHFAPLYQVTVPDDLVLDIEFKFHGPDRDLILKQVRPYAGR